MRAFQAIQLFNLYHFKFVYDLYLKILENYQQIIFLVMRAHNLQISQTMIVVRFDLTQVYAQITGSQDRLHLGAL